MSHLALGLFYKHNITNFLGFPVRAIIEKVRKFNVKKQNIARHALKAEG